eukprot:scaffold21006_cov72-Phaeocystis_antarctica.AAC.2
MRRHLVMLVRRLMRRPSTAGARARRGCRAMSLPWARRAALHSHSAPAPTAVPTSSTACASRRGGLVCHGAWVSWSAHFRVRANVRANSNSNPNPKPQP